jgi:hypothetical protein
MIPWNIVLQQMKSFDEDGNPAVFDLEVKALDTKRSGSRQILRLERFTVNGLRKKRPVIRHQEMVNKTKERNPNHRDNSTLNIKSIRTGEIKKIHLRLITRFNGDVVIY